MKKVLLTAFAVMASLSLMAQGQIDFANDASTKVLVKTTPAGTAAAAPVGSTYNVGLWWAPSGTTDPTAFTFLTGSASPFVVRAGMFSGGTMSITGQGNGPTLAIQVRGWQTSFGSYDAAVAGNGIAGSSAIFNMKTGNPAAVPTPELPAGLVAGGFTAFTMQAVPEPSTIALGLLGLAGLFVLRRRS